MGQRNVKPLKDEYGIIMNAVDELPEDLHEEFLKSVKELKARKKQFIVLMLQKLPDGESTFNMEMTTLSDYAI
ncbi:MAG: hypothetical protein MJY70_00855 [Bacteroidales bacterium]|nr:hypothetical protein [Bacteroidales bacterium]